jgi:hypothetical protein
MRIGIISRAIKAIISNSPHKAQPERSIVGGTQLSVPTKYLQHDAFPRQSAIRGALCLFLVLQKARFHFNEKKRIVPENAVVFLKI